VVGGITFKKYSKTPMFIDVNSDGMKGTRPPIITRRYVYPLGNSSRHLIFVCLSRLRYIEMTGFRLYNTSKTFVGWVFRTIRDSLQGMYPMLLRR